MYDWTAQKTVFLLKSKARFLNNLEHVTGSTRIEPFIVVWRRPLRFYDDYYVPNHNNITITWSGFPDVPVDGRWGREWSTELKTVCSWNVKSPDAQKAITFVFTAYTHKLVQQALNGEHVGMAHIFVQVSASVSVHTQVTVTIDRNAVKPSGWTANDTRSQTVSHTRTAKDVS